MGLSLWLVPSPAQAEKLHRIMHAARTDDAQSPSSFPPFAPHLTLASVPASASESESEAHLSLCYVDTPDAALRTRVAAGLQGARVVAAREVSGLGLDCSAVPAADASDEEAARDSDVLTGFDGEEIWVVRCEGPVATWEVLRKIVLGQ